MLKFNTFFPLIISFKKPVTAVAKVKQLRTQISQNRFSKSKPKFNKLMQPVSLSGFILQIGEN